MPQHREGTKLRTFVVVGAGAVGSILAAKLAQGGADVACVARGRRASQLREQGLRLRGVERIDVPVRVVEAAALREAGFLIFATKSYDMEQALRDLRHVRVGHAIALQNGVYKNEQLTRVFGEEKTLGGVAQFGGELATDGTVEWTIYERLSMGVLPGGHTREVDALGEELNRAGFRTEVSANIRTVEWSKYAVFVGLMPVAVLSRQPTHIMMRDPDLARAMLALFREMARLAEKMSIELEDAGGMTDIRTVTSLDDAGALEVLRRSGAALEARRATGHKVSTLQDLEHGRRFELDEILGYAVRKAAELGVPMPALETCYRLVAGVARSMQR
jgi:2-dehydropantoate 2-reductase